MIGGMISSALPTLIVIPAIFGLVNGFGLSDAIAPADRLPCLSRPSRSDC
jgi:hypothetical protein